MMTSTGAGALGRGQHRGGQRRPVGRPLVVPRVGAVVERRGAGGELGQPVGVGGVGGDPLDAGCSGPVPLRVITRTW